MCHLDLAPNRKFFLLKILAEWTEGKRTDHPPVNPWSLLMLGFVPSETRLKLAKLQAPHDTANVRLHDLLKVKAANQKKLRIAVLSSEMYDLHPTIMILHLHLGTACTARCGLGSL